MAKGKKKASSASRPSGARTRSAPTDAIGLLKADHRQVEEWFEEFESAGSNAKKQNLATNICQRARREAVPERMIGLRRSVHPLRLSEARASRAAGRT